jgi:Protein of unknown function (DUF2501)
MSRHFASLPIAVALLVAVAAPLSAVRAQMPSMPGMSGNSMPGMTMGGGQAAGMTGQGGLGSALGGAAGLPSVSSAGAGNLSGLLGFCVQNNYLGAGTASPVMSALGQRAGINGQGASQYQAGQNGILETGNGTSYTLAGAGQGIKQQVTRKVCNLVLSRAQSML